MAAEVSEQNKTPVTLHSEDPRVHRTLLKELQAQREQQTAALVLNMASSLEDYRHRTGIIRGLTTAIDLCERLEKEISGT